MPRITTGGRISAPRGAPDIAGVANIYESWRSDSGLSTATSSVWTGRKNGLILSQSTAGKRGTVVTNQLNGFSCMRQNGTNSLLQLASFAHAQPYAALFVFKCTAHAPGANSIALDLNAGTDLINIDTTPRTYIDGSAVCIYNTASGSSYTYLLCYWNTTNSFIMENGKQVATGNISNTAATNVTLGGLSTEAGNWWMQQDVVELSLFGSITVGDISWINNYARETYAIPGTA